MPDETIHFGQSGPLALTLGDLIGTLWMHDNGDGTYIPCIRDAQGNVTVLTAPAQCKVSAGGAIPANRLVKGHTNGTYLVGTLGSKRILGANCNGHALVAGMPLQLGTGYVKVTAAEPITAGDLIKCGDNGRVLQLADADNINTVIDDSVGGDFANQPANDGVTVVSNNVADITQTATIIGITHGGHVVVAETIALNGTTDADSVKKDWGLILAVKLSASCAGTVEISETSGGLAITTLTTGVLSKGVVVVPAADRGAHGLIPYMKAAAASTKEAGILYEPATGAADAYGAAALNGTTAVPLPAAANLVKELYVGDVAAASTATFYTNATEDDEQVTVGKAAETITAGAVGLVYVRP